MRKLRPGGARTSLGHRTLRNLLPLLWPLLSIFQVLGLGLWEAGHILLVAEQPCWEVLLALGLPPKALGGVGWCRRSSLGSRGCLVPPLARVARQLLSHLGPWSPICAVGRD